MRKLKEKAVDINFKSAIVFALNLLEIIMKLPSC